MKFISIVVILSLITMIVTTTAAKEISPFKSWPTIRSTQFKTHVTSEKSKVVLDIFSEDNTSEKLYELRCNKADADDKAGGEDYYGMFQCHLLALKEIGSDLLNGEDAWNFNKSYNTRGVFKYEQLIGPCKNNPEFGFHREFNMRGMKLKLTVSNFIAPPIVDMLTEKVKPHFSFDFEAKVTPNNKATSENTSPSAKKCCGGYYKLNDKGEAVYHESSN